MVASIIKTSPNPLFNTNDNTLAATFLLPKGINGKKTFHKEIVTENNLVLRKLPIYKSFDII